MKNFTFKLILMLLLLVSATSVFAQLVMMPKRILTGYENNPCYISFSAKGAYSVLTTSGAEIEIRDQDFNKLWTYQNSGNAGAGKGVFSPDEKYMIFSKFQSRGDVAVLRISDKKIIYQIKAHDEYVSDLVLSPDGKMLATCGTDSKIKIFQWKNEALVLLQTISVQISEQAYAEYANAIKFSPDSKYLVFGGRMGTATYDTQNKFLSGKPSEIQVFSLQANTFKLVQSLPERFDVEAIVFHPKGQYFVAATSERLLAFKLNGGKFVADRAFTDADYLGSLSFSPDGKYLAGSRMNIFKVWEWKNGSINLVHENEMSRLSIVDVQFSSDGNYLANSSLDKKLTFWELPNAPIAKNAEKRGETQKPAPQQTEPKKTDTNELEGFVPTTTGKNYLFLIGINQYKFWNPLHNAQKDAQDIKK
ncbi:MAG: hypothetical protein H7Y04_10080, partial [Verrucomicrobia bacterium]|nr:hypothetical protein [Cytophagales bacterium]